MNDLTYLTKYMTVKFGHKYNNDERFCLKHTNNKYFPFFSITFISLNFMDFQSSLKTFLEIFYQDFSKEDMSTLLLFTLYTIFVYFVCQNTEQIFLQIQIGISGLLLKQSHEINIKPRIGEIYTKALSFWKKQTPIVINSASNDYPPIHQHNDRHSIYPAQKLLEEFHQLRKTTSNHY